MKLVVSAAAILGALALPLAANGAAKSKAKAKPTPSAAHAVATPDANPVTVSEERPVTTGTATCKLGTKSLSFKKAAGSFQTSGGFQTASLKFEGEKGLPKMEIGFMYQGTGIVTADYIQHLFVIGEDKALSAMKPHVSTCTITLARATPSMVEGTATCPKGMLNEDKPGRPITDIQFHAEAE